METSEIISFYFDKFSSTYHLPSSHTSAQPDANADIAIHFYNYDTLKGYSIYALLIILLITMALFPIPMALRHYSGLFFKPGVGNRG